MVELFKALAEESRLRILSMLLEGEMCVCSIELCLNMTQSNASRHLNILRQNGILISYKKAQWTYYRLNEHFKEEHKDLYHYLDIRLKELSTYHEDRKKWDICQEKNVCMLSMKPH